MRGPLLAMLVLPGCGGGVFVCTDDASCSGGVCQPSGYCSFDDGACGSGQRYGEHAPGQLANACVMPELGTSSGAPADASSTSVDPVTTLDGTTTVESSASSDGSADPSAEDDTSPTTPVDPSESSSGEPPPPADCDVEDFDDDELDGWNLWANAPATAAVERGRLHLGFGLEPSNSGIGRDGAGLVGRTVDVELVLGPNPDSHAQLSITIAKPDDVSHMLVLERGTLAMLRWNGQAADIEATLDVGDMPPRHWRVVATAATLSWQYAYDDGEYVELAVEMLDDIDEMVVSVVANTWQDEVAPGEGVVERVSICAS